MQKPFIEAGKIVGIHGVRGEMRVLPYCDSPGFLTGFKMFYLDGSGGTPLPVGRARVHKNIVLVLSPAVTTADEAKALAGKSIYINRLDAKLPDGRYFIEDLLDCGAYTPGGEYLGRICAVSPTGANDVWHIRRGGAEYLIPAAEGVVISVAPESGRVVIDPPKGIFDDED